MKEKTEEHIRDTLTYEWLRHMVDMFGLKEMFDTVDGAKKKIMDKKDENDS